VLDPSELYALSPNVPDLGRPVLVQALDGFVDAGLVRHTVRSHLLETGQPRVVATFDVDQLFDYRARRPYMTFEEDHWSAYDEPVLALHQLTDASGTPFLLLSGPEPDVMWERFIAAVLQLVEQFGVRLTVGLNAIPMAVPHTRPIGMTAHGSRPELVPESERWIQTVQVPGSAGNLLEYRLGLAGHDAVGFAVHVPHYVAQMEYAPAAEALLAAVRKVSGLDLPDAALHAAAESTQTAISEHVADNPEVAAAVQALEGQYDAFLRGTGRGLLAEGTTRLPTADELGAELERFLAERAHGSEPPPES
jgi:hypothetical protein